MQLPHFARLLSNLTSHSLHGIRDEILSNPLYCPKAGDQSVRKQASASKCRALFWSLQAMECHSLKQSGSSIKGTFRICSHVLWHRVYI
ncbi:hypothetical protein Hypma_010746 [Hypsizygus marmoreus]|uniref:Uncharacterized protein n=1 Tax=Hypsizygus marmoreus TaxID=39966 RepID=A0A369JPC4_HYPMA|nr:hypothetical protein Hypma_010746 [Hypsizygus marmoreus]